MNESVFVTGIGTGVGKTVVSALWCRAFGADYWKPVQAGLEDLTDTERVKAWVNRPELSFHPERYRLKEAASPHAAAAKEGLHIQLSDFRLPVTPRPLLVEGAGGLLVPLNKEGLTISDLILHLGLPVVLVSRYYLGSINHTLLSIEMLRRRQIPLKAVLLTGEPVESSREVIAAAANAPLIAVPELAEINPSSICEAAEELRKQCEKAFAAQ